MKGESPQKEKKEEKRVSKCRHHKDDAYIP
jgi:hypothetical protein